ncbi:hypothetical protein ETD83_21605 [Actinomadura soli]|uniref:Uncharacterized protein n=1 Tax=Actinomadura soli TaxID=2508997 RepID=A0A5C4J9V7_9ACTN|nr:hypothetical protein [Actinomadura soli]TMQ96167.1 hypothetical protein ETD83_21605 [Actinomadura soli]
MGAKTALLAFSDGDIRPARLGATRSDQAETERLVRRIHPGHDVEPAGEGTLWDVNPPDDITYAARLPGVDVFCDWRLVFDRPSELPEHVLRAGAGRRIVMHGMHSVVDWFCFAVWEDGVLIRSLSLSPDAGIEENIGEPFDFERPYWAGEHPVEPIPGWPDEDPYPLPFHPLDLGEDALRALFGFVIEGRLDPDDVETEKVHLHRFKVTDPTGQEQAAREAAYAEAQENMGELRAFQMGPDGTMQEVSFDDL